MKNAVIIPVVQTDLARNLILAIINNTVVPRQLIIINNSKKDFLQELKNIIFPSIMRFDYINNIPPQPLNKSWKQGFNLVKDDIDLISVFNDDIIISDKFFEILNVTANNFSKNYVAFCPYTSDKKEDVTGVLSKEVEVMRRREGWAYTLRKHFFDVMEAIPDELEIFCGDDWIWKKSHEKGFYWLKMMSNIIYHYVGSTVKDIPGIKKILEQDKAKFYKLTGILLKKYY